MSSQELLSSQQTKFEVPSSDAPVPSSPSPAKKQEPSAEQNGISSTEAQDAVIQDGVSQEPSSTTEVLPQTSAAAPDSTPPNPRLAALQAKHATLQSKLAELEAQRNAYIADAKLPSGLSMPEDWTPEQKQKQALATANAIIKEHISLLHGYNEIKDIGQGLMGIVADKRQVRIAEVMEDFGMGEKD